MNLEHRSRMLAAGTVLTVAALAILYLFPPAQYAFYPRCGFYALTGLQCPGCGGLRATHCLLHGDLAGALGYNPLLVVLAPGVLALGAWLAVARFFSKPLPDWSRQPIWLWLLVSMGIAFAVLRNLPMSLAALF
jgi:hypothetical protein